jgi:hypothetical protein
MPFAFTSFLAWIAMSLISTPYLRARERSEERRGEEVREGAR